MEKSVRETIIDPERISGQLDTKTQIAFAFLVALVFILLILNVFSYFFKSFQTLWSSSLILIGIYFIFVFLNSVIQDLGVLCWPNIFLTLMVIFHLGYYVPLQMGLVAKMQDYPAPGDRLIPFGMTLFAAAMITFEAGILLGDWISERRKAKPLNQTTGYELRLIFRFGILLSFLSGLLLFIYIMQTGGIIKTFNMSYSDYIQFMSSNDPRAIATSLIFLPIGLLLVYIGIDRSDPRKSRLLSRIVIIVAFLLALWQFWLGSRGTAFLLVLSFVYIRHIWVKRFEQKHIIALLVVILLVSIVLIPVIKGIRNVPVAERGSTISGVSLNPLDALVEMGGTIRPYIGFLQLFPAAGANEYLHGKSYAIALGRIIPNIGFQIQRDSSQTYYRSNVWITQQLDPAGASIGIGLGSSGVAEPYINFGFPGLLIFFLFLGLAIMLLERYTIKNKSILAVALTAFMFTATNWYIRDDIYGVIRPIAWGLISILILFFLFKRKRLEDEKLQ